MRVEGVPTVREVDGGRLVDRPAYVGRGAELLGAVEAEQRVLVVVVGKQHRGAERDR